MAYRSSSNQAYTSGTSIAPAVPAGAAANDIAVACLYLEATGTVTPPSGWNATAKHDSGVVNNARLTIWWKRLTGADSGTYSFTTPNTGHACSVYLFSGRITTGDPFDLTSNSTALGTTVTCAALSPAASGDDLFACAASFAGGTWTPPTSMTERVDSDTNGNTQDNIAAGSTGTKTLTCTGSGGIVGFLGALLPASGGAATPPIIVMPWRRP